MRNRLIQPRSNPEPCGDVPSLLEPDRGTPVVRIFRAAELDLDYLAEAIRSLLGPASVPQISGTGGPKPELLSFPCRGTHVVEATETP